MTDGTQELSVTEDRPRTLAEMRAQKALIQEFLGGVMKQNVHYGVIPGTDKPTLYKPGSEVILSGLNLAVEPVEQNLSTPDEVHYIVHVRILTMKTRFFIGEGVGEASSNESKYKWRGAVCDEEFEETPADRRREVWKKGGKEGPYKLKQVRTEPADIANTVLKMAKKRAQIDATLTSTAASDIFNQDLEDLRDNGIDPVDAAGDANEEAPPVTQPRAKGSAAPPPKQTNGKNPLDFHGGIKFVGERKITKKDGDEGTIHVITCTNGIKYDTFSDTFADTARTALANATAVHLTASKNQWGYRVETLDPVLEG